MNVVVDTSVTMAWYLPESHARPAREWQERILRGDAHAMVPPLHYLEFGNVLRTYVKRREMDRAMAEELFALHLEAPLDTVVPPVEALLTIAFDYEATVYDAAFIALALLYDCQLVTAERSTTPWVVKLKRQVITVG